MVAPTRRFLTTLSHKASLYIRTGSRVERRHKTCLTTSDFLVSLCKERCTDVLGPSGSSKETQLFYTRDLTCVVVGTFCTRSLFLGSFGYRDRLFPDVDDRVTQHSSVSVTSGPFTFTLVSVSTFLYSFRVPLRRILYFC